MAELDSAPDALLWTTPVLRPENVIVPELVSPVRPVSAPVMLDAPVTLSPPAEVIRPVLSTLNLLALATCRLIRSALVELGFMPSHVPAALPPLMAVPPICIRELALETAGAPVTESAVVPVAEAVTNPLKLGLLTMVRPLQVPPEPRVIVLPVPVRFPVPLGHTRVVLPWTAVPAVEP